MPRILRSRAGLAAFDLLLAIVLLSLAAALITHSLHNAPEHRRERLLQERLEMFRDAVSRYQIDHGFYPGSSEDWGYPLSDAQLRAKLAGYTDHTGMPSEAPSHRFRFGPYLSELPAEPYGNSSALRWALQERRSQPELAPELGQGDGGGGWFYAPESGALLANLGREFPAHLAGL